LTEKNGIVHHIISFLQCTKPHLHDCHEWRTDSACTVSTVSHPASNLCRRSKGELSCSAAATIRGSTRRMRVIFHNKTLQLTLSAAREQARRKTEEEEEAASGTNLQLSHLSCGYTRKEGCGDGVQVSLRQPAAVKPHTYGNFTRVMRFGGRTAMMRLAPAVRTFGHTGCVNPP